MSAGLDAVEAWSTAKEDTLTGGIRWPQERSFVFAAGDALVKEITSLRARVEDLEEALGDFLHAAETLAARADAEIVVGSGEPPKWAVRDVDLERLERCCHMHRALTDEPEPSP